MALQAVKPTDHVDRDVTFAEWTQPFEIALRDTFTTLEAVLHDQSENFIKAVWLLFRRTPLLQRCTEESIKAAAVDLALSGLDITQKGHAWLIPLELEQKDERGNKTGKKVLECVVWDGYLGRIDQARNHPAIDDVECFEVLEGDTYAYRGFHELPKHELPENFGPRGGLLGAYAYVIFKTGRVKCIQMSKAEILAHRDQYAASAKSDAWQERFTGWGEKRGERVEKGLNRTLFQMAKKTVVMQLCHPRNIPMNRGARRIIERQEEILDSLKPVTGEDMQPTEPVTMTGTADTDLFPKVNTPRQQELLAEISKEFSRHVAPLQGKGRAFLVQACFSVEDWKQVPTLSLDDLEDGNRRWKRLLQVLNADLLPENHGEWPDTVWFDWFMEHCHIGKPETKEIPSSDSQTPEEETSQDMQQSMPLGTQRTPIKDTATQPLRQQAEAVFNRAVSVESTIHDSKARENFGKDVSSLKAFIDGEKKSEGFITHLIGKIEKTIATVQEVSA